MSRPAALSPAALGLRRTLLIAAALAAMGWVATLPPLPQQTAYHLFADSRAWLGVANTANVLSNAAFLLVGLAGLLRLSSLAPAPTLSRWRFFFLVVALVGCGSAYYHWSPDNNSLFWDRLPMTLAFASLTACLLADRLGPPADRLFWPLVAAGAASVVYWWLSEQAGAGDLRPYIVVQFLPMLLAPLVLILFPRGAADRAWWLLLAGYALAKVFELSDAALFAASGQIISGHTLKHLAAAGAILALRPPKAGG